MDLSWLYLVLYFIIGLIVMGMVFYGLLFGAMYMKIPTKKLKKIINLGNLGYKTVVYDLGAGLGTIAFEAAHTGAHVVAVEIDPLKVAAMKIMLSYNNRIAKAAMTAPGRGLIKGGPKVLDMEIVRANLLKVDLKEADVVYCYLFGPLMQQVGKKARDEMAKDSILVSVEHPILDWKPYFADKEDKIYAYRV